MEKMAGIKNWSKYYKYREMILTFDTSEMTINQIRALMPEISKQTVYHFLRNLGKKYNKHKGRPPRLESIKKLLSLPTEKMTLNEIHQQVPQFSKMYIGYLLKQFKRKFQRKVFIGQKLYLEAINEYPPSASLAEIADNLGISTERVRQILKKRGQKRNHCSTVRKELKFEENKNQFKEDLLSGQFTFGSIAKKYKICPQIAAQWSKKLATPLKTQRQKRLEDTLCAGKTMCSKCGLLPLDQFYRLPNGSFYGHCKTCHKEMCSK